MSDLRLILSQGRKRLGLLIGAGAPFSIKVNPTTKELATDGEPLIPTVPALTAAVVAALSAEDKAIVERITAERGGKPNIEDILSRVRLLGRAIGTETVHGYDANHYETLGQSICNKIGQLVGPLLPLEPNPYTELVAWIGGTSRESAVEIFTTNYDLLIEEALERARVPYFDGFSGGHLPFFDPSSVASDDLPARWTRVWKLHGSLGWSFEGGQVVRDGQRTTTQLIYPDHLKYEQVQRLPYSALFERFRQFLLTPDTLLLCSGFSFVDAHVSSVLEEALSANANAAVFAFQYGSLESEGLACKLAHTRPNLSVYASDGAVIRGVSGPWLLGDSPNREWLQIRQTFWGKRGGTGTELFTLGDFAELARFFSLAGAGRIVVNENLAQQVKVADPVNGTDTVPK